MKKYITTVCGILLCAMCAFAQESVLHENIVRPSMTDEYRAAVVKIKEACVANKINMAWRTFVFEDNSWAHLLPVEGTASLETDLWVELRSKIGQEAFDKLVSDLYTSVETQIHGTMVKMGNHSYGDPLPGEAFRMILFIFPIAGKEKETEDLFLEWKKHYQEKKSPLMFHVYKTSYGSDKGYIVGFPGKDPADIERKISETHALLGETDARLWKKQMSLTRKYFWKRGYVVPELSYAYAEGNVAKGNR